ncbi:hypothetical protein HBI73_147430 [Parastagonospora nodorum]|nr:hypothetical protein HBH50_096920 [Parastagonospora nodorum]KAH4090854.1 hypothetical protein HBH48_100690 [Parastagonospora nodorum]KAH5087350.1 hypothetical protein HBI73_147430 [Parastagonospora nodorum]KAH5412973.1 hypothetical protein HBI47_155580 [Parastagonospora nodorum]KAH5423985.1 hypothetical protein HBI32_087390 [Parastagonospora nodorum]
MPAWSRMSIEQLSFHHPRPITRFSIEHYLSLSLPQSVGGSRKVSLALKSDIRVCQATRARPMINIAKVSDWLTRNANEQLYPRLFLMSPNGTLLAYSTPVDIKELRDQAALISIAWKEHCQGRQKPPSPNQRKESTRSENSVGSASAQSLQPALRTLTIQSRDCNILVRLLQPELLLVLVGNIPPRKNQSFKINAEGFGDPRYPSIESTPSRPGSSSNFLQGDAAIDSGKRKAPSIMSNMSQRDRDIRQGVLHVQRKRLDALSDYALRDFESTGFIMPADSDLQ